MAQAGGPSARATNVARSDVCPTPREVLMECLGMALELGWISLVNPFINYRSIWETKGIDIHTDHRGTGLQTTEPGQGSFPSGSGTLKWKSV